MTYVKTTLQHSIDIDAIITLHYFEYMKNFEFKGESHNFWEFLYVDKGTVAVRADDTWTTLYTGDIIFHQPNEFHAIKSIGKDSPNLVVMSFTSSSQAMSFFVNKSFTLSMEERAMISRIITEGRHTLATPMHIPSVEQVQLKELNSKVNLITSGSFSMLTKEPLPSVLMTPGLLSKPEISSFTNQMNSMRSNPSEKTLRIW